MKDKRSDDLTITLTTLNTETTQTLGKLIHIHCNHISIVGSTPHTYCNWSRLATFCIITRLHMQFLRRPIVYAGLYGTCTV